MISRARTVTMPKGTSTMPMPAAGSATRGRSVPLRAVWLPASVVARGGTGGAEVAMALALLVALVVVSTVAVVVVVGVTGMEVTGTAGPVGRDARDVGLGLGLGLGIGTVGVRRVSGPMAAVDTSMVL